MHWTHSLILLALLCMQMQSALCSFTQEETTALSDMQVGDQSVFEIPSLRRLSFFLFSPQSSRLLVVSLYHSHSVYLPVSSGRLFLSLSTHRKSGEASLDGMVSLRAPPSGPGSTVLITTCPTYLSQTTKRSLRQSPPPSRVRQSQNPCTFDD